MSETEPKNQAPSGSSAMVAAHCVRTALSTKVAIRLRPKRVPAQTQTIASTAPKDNQKPADSGAQGSSKAITAADAPTAAPIEAHRPLPSSNAAIASMKQVR